METLWTIHIMELVMMTAFIVGKVCCVYARYNNKCTKSYIFFVLLSDPLISTANGTSPRFWNTLKLLKRPMKDSTGKIWTAKRGPFASLSRSRMSHGEKRDVNWPTPMSTGKQTSNRNYYGNTDEQNELRWRKTSCYFYPIFCPFIFSVWWMPLTEYQSQEWSRPTWRNTRKPLAKERTHPRIVDRCTLTASSPSRMFLPSLLQRRKRKNNTLRAFHH